jgi:hypothetical protein
MEDIRPLIFQDEFVRGNLSGLGPVIDRKNLLKETGGGVTTSSFRS